MTTTKRASAIEQKDIIPFGCELTVVEFDKISMTQLLDYFDLSDDEFVEIVLRDVTAFEDLHSHVLLTRTGVGFVDFSKAARADLMANDES